MQTPELTPINAAVRAAIRHRPRQWGPGVDWTTYRGQGGPCSASDQQARAEMERLIRAEFAANGLNVEVAS